MCHNLIKVPDENLKIALFRGQLFVEIYIAFELLKILFEIRTILICVKNWKTGEAVCMVMRPLSIK